MGHSASQQDTPLGERLDQAAGGRTILLFALGQWAKNFPASFADEDAMVGKVRDWRDLMEQHPWVTDDVFRRTVSLVRFKFTGPFVPGLAELLDFCHLALSELRRETEKALPPPPLPPGPDDPGQISAKEAARAYLRARGLAK